GGSLRYYAQRADTGTRPVEQRVHDLVDRERALGYDTLEGHLAFTAQVEETKWSLLEFLIAKRREGKRIAGYGAPGKGNTLLNYCGIRTDLLRYTVDRNPYKHGRFTPGTRIPIHPPERIAADRPDYVLVLPWNLRTELTVQLSYIADWGGRLVFPIPRLEVVSL
ncbi:MAG: methyltransferase C-terminal domain-containing protein, partial [Pseudonocardiaceae bacterium]